MSDNAGGSVMLAVVVLFFGIMIISASTSSATKEEYAIYWTGKTESELVTVMGPPTRTRVIVVDKVLIYEEGTYPTPAKAVWHSGRRRWWHHRPTHIVEKNTIQYVVNGEGVIKRVIID